MRRYFLGFLVLAALLAVSCGKKVPTVTVSGAQEAAVISPDYADVVFPCNFQPLNFNILSPGDKFVTRVTGANGGEIVAKGAAVRFKLRDWKALVEANKDADLTYTVYARRGGQWTQLASFSNHVSSDPIDEYLTYRLLAPSYEFYTAFQIRQRNLSTGEDREVYNNRMHYNPKEQQCMNCHNFRNYKTEDWQMHVRQVLGGTLIITGNDVRKVNLKTDQTVSAGVYPSWHPSENLIAYSVNRTRQFFHEKNIYKVEVQDPHSDLILYDLEKNTVRKIADDTLAFETFPAWSPDGRSLYFSSAQQPEIARASSDSIAVLYDQIRCDIVRMSFDPATREFGAPETVFDAKSLERSALLPRISPDGRYLLFSLGGYGTFHIWHRDSDIWVMNLETGESYPLTEANSDDADSYHVWDSSGRWIAITTRRDDGVFTRTYFAYFDRDGKAHKAFMLPQSNPAETYDRVLSYNVPEFTVEPIRQSLRELSHYISEPVQSVQYAE
jgi:hypothetical protein